MTTTDPKLEVVAPPNGLKVWAVEDRLVQVLRNLIGNAHSFSPPRGRIVLRVREVGGVRGIVRGGRWTRNTRRKPGAYLRPVLLRATQR